MKKSFYSVALNPSIDISFSLPKLLFDDINRIESKRIDPGGKGINVAHFLHILGENVMPVGVFGGFNGDLLISLIKKSGLKSIKIFHVKEETREIFNFFINGKVIRINEKGPSVPLNVQSSIKKFFLGINEKNTWIIFSGSLPPKIKSDFYANLIDKIKRGNPYIKIAVDTDGEALNKCIKSSPTLIKPNLYELERFKGTKIRNFSEFLEIGKTLLDSGITYVLVTFGKNGAVGFSKSSILWSKPPLVREKSSVGCGDIFLSGFLHKISSGVSFEESLRFAVACGTAKVKEEGTKMPSICEVKKTYKNTRIISCLPAVPYELKKLFHPKGSE